MFVCWHASQHRIHSLLGLNLPHGRLLRFGTLGLLLPGLLGLSVLGMLGLQLLGPGQLGP